ncbi:MAG: 6-pyruvoyl-tetrahydropterin synthase-related protein, partial [Anaerolineae bacterium]|nr:6-pyruvoyl-tetrahydropterin synthase-related protein [Anaerolineae bacterium]
MQSSLRRPSADHIDERPSLLERVAKIAGRLWRSGWWAPLLLTLPALAPLLRPGFYVSDDGLFHIYRISALADAWQHGAIYPRLFPQFGFGYGQAVFNFYAPLSYFPGALLSALGVSPEVSAEWTVALGFVLAAFAAYGMGKYLWGRGGGLLAAVVYTYFPYHLADAYLRGALPEHMAFVFLPLIIWTTAAAFREPQQAPSYLWSALAWAGLAYTHNLTLLLMIPVWFVLALLLALRTSRWNRFWGCVGGAVLGAGLSAALWLPFLAESKQVGIGLGPSDGYINHLAPLRGLIQWRPLYQYRASHGAGAAEHPLSWASVAFAALALIRLLVSALRRKALPGDGFAWYGLGLFVTASLLTAAPALPVWRLLQPILGQLQYPWRFMTLAALGLAMAAGVLAVRTGDDRAPADSAGDGTVSRGWLAWGGLILALSLTYMASGLARVPVAPVSLTSAEAWGTARMWADDAAAGQVGATWTGEFLPQTVREQRWALGRPLEGAGDGQPLKPPPSVRLASVGYDRLTLAFDANPPPQVRLHQFHLPAWWGYLDGQRVKTYPS